MKARPVELLSRPGKIFLVLGRVVPALDRCPVGEFENHDAFRFRTAFEQVGRATTRQEPSAILRQGSGDGSPIFRHTLDVGDIEFRYEIGRHFALPSKSDVMSLQGPQPPWYLPVPPGIAGEDQYVVSASGRERP